MSEESTTELLNILNKLDQTELDQYIQQYGHTETNVFIFSEYIAKHHLSVATIVRNSKGLISKSYIYDILSGTKKNPSRDILLILCIAANMDRKSTRRILEVYGQRDLYAKDTRDIIIATYINNKNFNLDLINEELYRHNLPTLHSCTA